LELFGDISTKLTEKFPWMDLDLVQVSRGDTQSQRLKPSYCFQGLKKNAQERRPISIKIGSSRPWEKRHFRCVNRMCPLRPEVLREGLPEQPKDVFQEIDNNDKEVDLLKAMLDNASDDENDDAAGGAPTQEEKDNEEDAERLLHGDMEADSGPASRNYTVEVFPYSNPVDYYRALFSDLGLAHEVDHIILMSTSAHPGSSYEAKKRCPTVSCSRTGCKRMH